MIPFNRYYNKFNILSIMLVIVSLLFLVFIFFCQFTYAEIVTLDDGRVVKLHEDGTFTVLSESMVTLGIFFPLVPDQLSNAYSELGLAIKLTVSPSLYCDVAGLMVPPSGGLTVVVNV